jgi:hypothetical protein
MVDFETLDTQANGVILSVGAVLFDKGGIIRSGYSEFDRKKQVAEGRTVSKATMAWWLRTNKKELNRLSREGKSDIHEWVKSMKVKLKKEKPFCIWSRGSMDAEMIKNLFGERFIPFYKYRDVRTLDEFGYKMDVENNHNALDDCINQINYVWKVFNSMEEVT